jgi:cobalt-zinc-cadmium efflux system membrane fusion protein
VTQGRSFPPRDGGATVSDREGRVKIPEQSLQYLTLEPVEARKGPLAMRVPARMEFRDGAISEIGAPMSGRVTSIQVKRGDRVATGDPLVILSCPDAASARTSLSTAQAALREARAAFERETRMLEEGVGIERDKLAAEIRLEAGQAELDRAQATSAFIGEGNGAEVALRSPMSGIVLDIKTTRGASVVAGGDALIEVGDPTALWVVAEVPERELSLVKEGAEATLDLASVPQTSDRACSDASASRYRTTARRCRCRRC